MQKNENENRPLPHTFKSQLKTDYLTVQPETINILEANRTKGVTLNLTKIILKQKKKNIIILLQELTLKNTEKNDKLTNHTVSN